MRFYKFFSIFVLLSLFLAGCAAFSPSYEKPQVNITSLRLAPQSKSNAASPTFLIGLQVINPNRRDLPLQGMSYSLEVDEQRILSGAEPDLPRIPGYGTAEFTIQASPDLLGSARLLNQLISGRSDTFDYRFKAQLDVGSFLPFITIEEQGEFNFGNTKKDATI